MKKLALLSACLIGACSPPTVDENAAVENLEAIADNYEAMADLTPEQIVAMGDETATGWVYDERKDEMRGETSKFARLDANSPINLNFPYGSSTPKLTIRQDAKYGFDIFITANGQFLCRSWDNDTLSVKFDDGPIREWSCAESDGGSSDIVFFNNERSLLSEIRKAKRFIVEANMYDAGRQQMTFDVAGLEWER